MGFTANSAHSKVSVVVLTSVRSQLTFTLPPSGRGSFIINAPALGRPDPVRSGPGFYRDVWLVSVRNERHITAVPPVSIRSAGRLYYTFLLCLPPATPVPLNGSALPAAPTEFDTYHLRLFLVKGGVNTSSMRDFGLNVVSMFEKSNVTYEADIKVPRRQSVAGDLSTLAASEWPRVNGFMTAESLPRRRKCKARDINSIGEGWMAPRTVQLLELPGLDAHGVWQTSRCDFPLPNRDALRTGLSGRWLALIGDSSVQEQTLISIDQTLGVPLNFSMEFETGKACHWYRMMDTGVAWPGMEGMRVSHFWAGGPKVCRDWEGVKSYEDADFLENMQRRLTLGGRPHAVIFNSGLHDLHTPVAAYARGLAFAFKHIRKVVGPQTVVAWKSTLASSVEAMVVFEEFNAVALELLAEAAADGPVALIDQFALTLPKFILGSASANPNHCGDCVPVDPGCSSMNAAIAVLLDDREP